MNSPEPVAGEFSASVPDIPLPGQFFARARFAEREVELVCAVIDQAVLDFRKGACDHDFRRFKTITWGERVSPWVSALHWFNSDDQHPFSFYWCCEVLAKSTAQPFDHRAVRRQLMSECLENEVTRVRPKLVPILGGKNDHEKEMAAA